MEKKNPDSDGSRAVAVPQRSEPQESELNLPDFDSFEERAIALAFYPKLGIGIYPALGLCGEAGEVSEKIKKLHRDFGGTLTPERVTEIEKEVGDVLWYVASMCHELGFSMQSAAEACIRKLEDRSRRNKLSGNGDNR
jgi:NTP pyrophosphatase (non-canonical NTP hydrolase)